MFFLAVTIPISLLNNFVSQKTNEEEVFPSFRFPCRAFKNDQYVLDSAFAKSLMLPSDLSPNIDVHFRSQQPLIGVHSGNKVRGICSLSAPFKGRIKHSFCSGIIDIIAFT